MFRAVPVERFSLSSVVLRAVLRGSHVRFSRAGARAVHARSAAFAQGRCGASPYGWRAGEARDGVRRKDVRAVKKTGIPKALAWTPTSTIVPSIDWVLPNLRPPKSIDFQA